MPAIAQKQQHSAAVVAAPVSAINSSQSELTPANQFGSSSTIDDPRVPALPAKPRELPTEMQKIKKMEQIKQYLESNRLPVKIEQAINRVVTTDQMPDDCVGSFINHITPSLPTPILRSIEVTEGVDSRGQSTFSITVDCLYRMRNYVSSREDDLA
jgi:hypothetical protein